MKMFSNSKEKLRPNKVDRKNHGNFAKIGIFKPKENVKMQL